LVLSQIGKYGPNTRIYVCNVHVLVYKQGCSQGGLTFLSIDADPVARLIADGTIEPHKAVVDGKRFKSFDEYRRHLKKLMKPQNIDTTRSGASQLSTPPTAAQTAVAKKIVQLAHSRRVTAATVASELARTRIRIAEVDQQYHQLRVEFLFVEQKLLSQTQAATRPDIRWNYAYARSLPSMLCRHFTGLDGDAFEHFTEVMTNALSHNWKAKTSFEDALTIFLIKLRLDLPYDIMALPTEIPASTLCRHFHDMLPMIACVTHGILCCKTREDIMRNAGACFNLPNAPGQRTGLIIDAFEVS
jgi:hypothetical protein